jgi:hypothetical protein
MQSAVLDLPIGSIGWILGPQNLGGLRSMCIIFSTLLLDFHTYPVLYFLNNPSVVFLTQLHSISEYCRILNTPHHLCLYWNWLNTFPCSSSREGGELGGASQVDYSRASLYLNLALAISAYHHWCCEFESWSGRGVQSLSVTCYRSVVFSGSFGFSHQ